MYRKCGTNIAVPKFRYNSYSSASGHSFDVDKGGRSPDGGSHKDI